MVIRGTTEKLMSRLMEDGSSVDPTFTEDFLLTYRTFLDSPVTIMERLLEWFEEARLRDKVWSGLATNISASNFPNLAVMFVHYSVQGSPTELNSGN